MCGVGSRICRWTLRLDGVERMSIGDEMGVWGWEMQNIFVLSLIIVAGITFP